MKGSLIRLIAIAVFLPTLVLMGISGYFLYQNFTKYQEIKKGSKYLELTKKLENVLLYLGQERGVSSIYSVSKGNYPNSKKLIQQKRALFSNAIRELKDFVNKNPEYYNDVKDVIILTNQLPAIRKKIDSFKENYIKTYFFNYYTQLENKILKDIAKIQSHFPQKIQNIYKIKIPFEKIIAYTGIIRGFGSYYITADTPMSENEYINVLLKYYHDINLLPLNLLNQSLSAPYFSKKFKKLEENVKLSLFYIQQANMQYYTNEEFEGYPIDAIDYFNLFTQRIKYFKNTTNALNKQINQNLTSIINEAKNNLIINTIVQIIAILIILIGIYILRLIKTHIQELSDLLNSLAPVIGENIEVDISSTKGINEAIKIVDNAIKVIQEAVKKSEEATKAKSLFLANMSHEIRTPLNGILGFLEILKTTPLTKEQEEYVNTISQSAKNLLQIVNNILDVSKIESNKVTLEIIDFKTLDEIENTLEIFATPAAQKEIQYVTEISPNMPTTVKGDILKIKEILTNLINNAIKFTPEKGTISIKAILKEIVDNKAKIYFEVKDTGIGMTEEQKEKIFEAFTQADASVTRKYGGTGLGLTIVKSYLEMMGSKIEVESEVNKGTKFFFTLELEVVDATPRYKENSLSTTTIAILNTLQDSLRKDYTNEYLRYFGISRIGFNSANELKQLQMSEKIDGVLIYFEESSKEEIEKISQMNIPLIVVSSIAYKEELNKINVDDTIYDPVMPSKTYNTIGELKRIKVEKTQPAIQKVEEKPLYKLRALIAEDNPINRKLLQTKLKSMGIESDIAVNGLEAFNKYTMNPEKYDVIFMDVQMPTMDGVEATQEILEYEKEEELPHTPIIAVTANVLKGDRERFLGAGMDDYISKPIETPELERVLTNVAKNKYSTKKLSISQIENEPKTENKPKIESENKSEIEDKTISPTNTETKSKQIVLASDSTFLANYLKTIIKEEFIHANSIKNLSKLLNNNTILLLEEDFENADIQALIKSIKSEFPNIKIILIGETKYDEIDDIIMELEPNTLTEIIKKYKG